MKALGLRTAAIALAAAASTFLFPACAPECVDFADCAEKAKAANQTFTCENGVCKAGSPFPDAGETGGGTGGGGDTGGGAGGGGGATGGGGGDMDAGTDDAGTDDAGTDDAGTDDAGTNDAGTDDAGTDLDAGTDAGTVTPAVDYVASLSEAQAVPPSGSGETGSGTFAVSELGDGGFSLSWSITHTSAGGTTGGFRTNWAGFDGPLLHTFANAASPIVGNRALTPAQADDVAVGKVYVWLLRQGNEIRGQLIPAGNSLWTSQMNTTTPGATRGGAQFVVPADGGVVSYFGIWTNDVVATDAHIHQGGVGGTGGAIVPLTVGADAGTFAGTFDPATLAAGDTDGGLYVNVHTTAAPNGLIRGQLVKH